MNDLNRLVRADAPSEVLRLIEDESTSDWLRAALWQSLTRDPLDALSDAEALFTAVDQWARGAFWAAGREMPGRFSQREGNQEVLP